MKNIKKLLIALCVATLPLIYTSVYAESKLNSNEQATENQATSHSKFVVLTSNNVLTKFEVYSSTGELVYSSDKSSASAILDVENWNKGRYTVIMHHNHDLELAYFTVF